MDRLIHTPANARSESVQRNDTASQSTRRNMSIFISEKFSSGSSRKGSAVPVLNYEFPSCIDEQLYFFSADGS